MKNNYSHYLYPSIIREYDIRGIVGETLFAQDAYYIGKAFASIIIAMEHSNNIIISVGRDGRESSSAMSSMLIDGIISCGIDVIDIGLAPTPMLYYSTYSLGTIAGVMVTGSHNPPSHNGFKFIVEGKPFFGEDIIKLAEIIREGHYANNTNSGMVINNLATKTNNSYIDTLASSYLGGERESIIAWDAGNGVAGPVIVEICKTLPGKHIIINDLVDGTFPNHSPDPTVPENLEQLKSVMIKHNCDFGFAFDGDADRVVVVNKNGDMIHGDQLLLIFAQEILKKHPKSKIIADVKTSDSVFNEIKKLGGIPLMCKTGHSYIKNMLYKENALLAGEMSGHFFFADRYFGYDDGIYAAVRMVDMIARSKLSLQEIYDNLPKTYATPEIRIDCPEERKFVVVDEIKQRLIQNNIEFSDIDGVRVNSSDGWWLLRASNTQSALVARCEADSDENLQKIIAQLKNQLEKSEVVVKIIK
jgi:phosphomannomutase